jgi:predicted molibdopterin-dependent oxidoreductase YjgC
VRRAAAELGATLIVVHPRRNGLDKDATLTVRYRPGEGSDLPRKLAAGDESVADVAAALGEGPVVAIVGRTGTTEDARLAEAVAAYARELPDARIMPVVRRGNTYGALDMGLAPTLLPGRITISAGREALEAEWGPLPTTEGKDATGILQAAASGEIKALVLTGADPVNDHPTPGLAADALDAAEFVVAFDLFLTDTGAHADVVLPVEGFGETDGTVTNLEGRVQKVNRIVPGPGQSRALWAILDDLTRRMGGTSTFPSANTVAKEIAAVAPAYRDISWDLLDWGEGRDGVVVPTAPDAGVLEYVPVDPGLTSTGGRYALHAGRSLYDGGVMVSQSPSLSALRPEAAVAIHPRDAAVLAVNDGDTVVVTGDHGAAELPVMIDDSLADRTVAVVANLPETAILRGSAGVDIEVPR